MQNLNYGVSSFVLDAVAHLLKADVLNVAEAVSRTDAANLILDTFFGPSWRTSERISHTLTSRGL